MTLTGGHSKQNPRVTHTHDARFSETAGRKLEVCKSERKPVIAHHESKLHRPLVWRIRPRSKRFIILKKRFSHFIQKVYETDPLMCPKWQEEMRIISFIDQAEIIIHSKRNSIAHELSPTQDAINASFSCVLGRNVSQR